MHAQRGNQQGATLLDTIFGVSLMLLVFVGITAVFQLSIDVVSNNKARTGAVALAQERMEFIRSLSYGDVGTDGGIPDGALAQEEAIALNGVSYTRTTLIRYMDDPKDGEGGDDANGITADSKEAKVTVSWESQNGGSRSVELTSRISPPGIEQAVPGGTLSIFVVDSSLGPVSSATVSIENATVTPAVDVEVSTDSNGEATFIGAPEGAGYEITITRTGYSSAQTYTADVNNPNPSPGHLTVLDSQTTASTFAIDLTSTKTVITYEAAKEISWTDTFADNSLLASSTAVTVTGGALELIDPATSPGMAESFAVTSTRLRAWKELTFADTEPVDTEARYRIFYDNGGSFEAIPDVDLPGNAVGFTTSPVDLTGLATTTYNLLRVHTTLTSNNGVDTPSVDTYSLVYEEGPVLLPNIVFSMQGDKTIGTDGGGAPIYKYDQTHDVGPDSSIDITDLEWDTYTITVDGAATGYDIAESCEPQPLDVEPGTTITTELFLVSDTAHSLLVDVRDNDGVLLSNASVRLYRGVFDETQTTSGCGQTHFADLSEGTVSGGDAYSVDVSLTGYDPFTSTGDVEVTGAARLSVILDPS